MSYQPRPYQLEAISAVESAYRNGRRSVLMVLPTGTGKCLAQNTPVLMHDGSIKAVQDVRQDDLLMGADSSPRRVLSTCTGMEMMWRVVPVKGDPYVVNESHILSLKMTNGATKGSGAKGSGYMPGTVHNISVADYLNTSKTFKHCAKGYRVGVQFPFRETDPALPPYLLGLWLGDGSSDSPIITNPDVEIQDWLQGYCDSIQGLQLSHYRYESQCDQMRIHSGRNPHANPMLDALRAHDLLHNKHVPYIYKCNSEEVRLEVLAGIIDTDGHLTCGGYDLIFKQQRLADDVAYLSRSLGMAAYVKSCRKGIKSRGFESDYWRVSISGDVSRIPVKIGRKKSSARRQVKDVLMTGIRVEPVGIGDYYGFELDGDGLFLLGDFTVTHNTNVFCWLIQRRFERGDRRAALIVAHREELLTQAAERIRALAPELSVGIERAEERAERGSQVVVASVQTIARGTRLQGFRPGLVVIDECFPAGTRIDGRPIEQIRVGDLVESVDHETGFSEHRRVTRLFRSPAKELMRITLSNGRSVVCTPGHPVFANFPGGRRDYVPAWRLSCYNMVCCITQPPSGRDEHEDNCAALHDMQGNRDMQWSARAGSGATRKGLLLGGVQGGVPQAGELRTNGRDESEACIPEDEGSEPDAFGGISGADGDNAASNGMETPRAGRKWAGADSPTEAAGVHVGVGDGAPDTNRQAERPGNSNSLQGGHCRAHPDDRYRGGRRLAQIDQAQGRGCGEDGGFEWAWVDRVEVLQPGSDGTFGGVCPNGLVYNLEVEGNHNYFAEGLLVHNCHHAAARGYGKMLEQFAGPKTQILGVTATPKRLDRKAISGAGAVFEEVAYSYPIRQAIQDGFLCDLRGYRVETETDLSQVATRQGDFAAGDLAAAVDNDARTAAALKHWQEVARDRRTVVFCAGVEHARHVADAFREAGVMAEMVSGALKRDDRAAIIDRFRNGRTQVLANCEVLTEGFDVPAASCALLLRPTQSWGLYVQMCGRVTRLAPGKREAIIIDVVDNCNRHRLATVPAILDLPPGLDLQGNSLLRAAQTLDEVGERAAVLQKALPGTWDELQTMLSQVDLFADLGTPEEMGETRFKWLRLPGGYGLSCSGGRHARLEEDALGQWTLELSEGDSPARRQTLLRVALGEDLAQAAEEAGRLAWQHWPADSQLLLREARWNANPPSDKQIHWLRKKGIAESVIEGLDRGQASALLTRLFNDPREKAFARR